MSKQGLKLDDISGPNDRLRFDHWMVGCAQIIQGDHKLLGIGPRNFTSIKVDQLKFSKPLETYPSVWQIPCHAHNLFLTKWCEEGISAEKENLQAVSLEPISDWVNSHREGKVLYIPDIFALPPENEVRKILEPQGIKSLMTVPMMEAEECVGFLRFDSVTEYHVYSEREKALPTPLAP